MLTLNTLIPQNIIKDFKYLCMLRKNLTLDPELYICLPMAVHVLHSNNIRTILGNAGKLHYHKNVSARLMEDEKASVQILS